MNLISSSQTGLSLPDRLGLEACRDGAGGLLWFVALQKYHCCGRISSMESPLCAACMAPLCGLHSQGMFF
jgi:hypothetical protein